MHFLRGARGRSPAAAIATRSGGSWRFWGCRSGRFRQTTRAPMAAAPPGARGERDDSPARSTNSESLCRSLRRLARGSRDLSALGKAPRRLRAAACATDREFAAHPSLTCASSFLTCALRRCRLALACCAHVPGAWFLSPCSSFSVLRLACSLFRALAVSRFVGFLDLASSLLVNFLILISASSVAVSWSLLSLLSL